VTHAIQAVVGPPEVVAKIAATFQHAESVALGERLHIIFVTDALFDEIQAQSASLETDPYPEFFRLSAGLARVLALVSTHGPVGYLETEYFGGVGTQAAILWRSERVQIGPLQHDTSSGESPLLPINAILKNLGVSATRAQDEFDTVGLGRFRRMPDA
jgi:hypothetical protein